VYPNVGGVKNERYFASELAKKTANYGGVRTGVEEQDKQRQTNKQRQKKILHSPS
jgi:hypothetical protein